MRPATEAELERWDELVAANPSGAEILQTRTWGEFKGGWSWTPRYMIAEVGHTRIATLFLTRHVPALGKLWYAAKGPGVRDAATVLRMFDDRSVFGDAFLVQVEPEIVAGSKLTGWQDAGWRRAPSNIQPTWATIFIDLRIDEDELLSSFKRNTRYNIRLAARKGVVVRRVPVDDHSIETMFGLMAQTQARAGFRLRPRAYCESYWRVQHACDQGQFFFAYIGEEVVAGVFVTYLGKRAWYKDGGSTRSHPAAKAPYLLQWEVMRWLKSRAIETYDLYAVPPARELEPSHSLYGLYMFKSRFCSTITEFIGTWELPLRASAVRVWDRLGGRLLSRRRDLFY
jgi:lipid II:glycine glycyltransferase (peptidoglycan interpeptide bridge formation enzyme)